LPSKRQIKNKGEKRDKNSNSQWAVSAVISPFLKTMKTALILPTIKPQSLEFGGMTTIEDKILFENGSVLDLLPNLEVQSHTYFDDYGCVWNSMENGLQILVKKQIETFSKELQDFIKEKYYKDGEPNFSNRDIIVLSGTRPRIGNSGDKVLQTVQNRGVIPQVMGDWDTTSRDPQMTELKFYAYERTPEAEKIAEELNKRLKITGEWVSRNKWAEASKRGVLQVYVNAWYKDENGKYYNPTGKHNHAVLMASYRETKILDSYRPEIKELSSWNDAYYWALKINIEEKHMEKPKIENNSLLQLVEGGGGFGMFLDGKIYIDNTADILASVIMRNGGKLDGKIKALTQEQWGMFEKYNLKGEKLS
jgi:hypothetical protein